MRALSLVTLLLVALTPVSSSAQEFNVSVDELYVGGPDAPVIVSLDGLDEVSWYQAKDYTFSWELPEDLEAVAAEVSTTSGREPMKAYRPPVGSLTISASELTEGENYLAVQFKNSEKWGMFATRQIKIDNTPPEVFSINLRSVDEEQGAVLLSWSANDQLSGISHYLVLIDDARMSERVEPEESRGYLLDLESSSQDQYQVRVVAYDQAGNTREATISVIATDKSVLQAGNGVFGSVAKEPASLLVAVMSAIMLMMFGYLIYERLRYAAHLKALRRETADIHQQLLRIFSALREEIYDQIQSITKKTRLSKGEKEAVDGLNRALSVSEALIEREIKDVKELLDEESK